MSTPGIDSQQVSHNTLNDLMGAINTPPTLQTHAGNHRTALWAGAPDTQTPPSLNVRSAGSNNLQDAQSVIASRHTPDPVANYHNEPKYRDIKPQQDQIAALQEKPIPNFGAEYQRNGIQLNPEPKPVAKLDTDFVNANPTYAGTLKSYGVLPTNVYSLNPTSRKQLGQYDALNMRQRA